MITKKDTGFKFSKPCFSSKCISGPHVCFFLHPKVHQGTAGRRSLHAQGRHLHPSLEPENLGLRESLEGSGCVVLFTDRHRRGDLEMFPRAFCLV